MNLYVSPKMGTVKFVSGWVIFWFLITKTVENSFLFGFFSKSVNDKIIVIYLKFYLDFLFVFSFDMIGFSLKFACSVISISHSWKIGFIYYSLGFSSFCIHMTCNSCISAKLADSSHSSWRGSRNFSKGGGVEEENVCWYTYQRMYT